MTVNHSIPIIPSQKNITEYNIISKYILTTTIITTVASLYKVQYQPVGKSLDLGHKGIHVERNGNLLAVLNRSRCKTEPGQEGTQ